MPDRGHELTEKRLRELEKELKGEYEIASREVAEKYEKYMAKFADDLKQQKALLDAGKITQKEYNDFVYRKTMTGKRWQEMRDTLAADYHNANEIALKQARGGMADVYALNANYATYQIEHDGKINTGFTLYNHDTAEYLIGDERQLMPGPSTKKAAEIAANKDMQWNRQKIQSAVLQGVLQGESPYQVADRLMQVGQMNYNSAVRYSRTMTTSAQNAGRYEAYKRAESKGVKLTIEWQATLDGRTRHDHRMMHGQRRDVGEPFITPDGFEILYPADCSGESDAPQKEIWNCRCTLLSWVKGFEGDTVKSSPKMGNMTFEEWQNEKAPKQKEEEEFVSRFVPASNIQEAEAFAQNFCDTRNQFGAIGIDYTGVDVNVANRVNKTLVDLYDEFDVKPFGGIKAPAGNTKEGKMISDAAAAYSPVRHSFFLNRKTFGSETKAAASFSKNRQVIKDVLEHPEKYDLSKARPIVRQVINASKISGRDTVPDTIEGALYHEFGHSLERRLRGLDNYGAIVQNMSIYAPKLSGYATTETSEYIAESFASWRLGEGLVDPEIAKAFGLLRRKR